MTRLEHRTLSSAIGARIRQEILDGQHVAGAQLRQEALAQAYGVSRIPVREALFALESEGLVQIVPHKGAIVSGLSREEVDDVFDLRAMLEIRLLRAALPAMQHDDFARLDEIHGAFIAAVTARDVRRFGELNADFHLALYTKAGLPRTFQIVTGLLQTSDRYTRLQLSSAPAMQRAQAEHQTLIDLCRDRRQDDACEFLASHIEAVRGDLVRLIAKTAERSSG